MGIRQAYRPLTDGEKSALTSIKAAGILLIDYIEANTPKGREQSLAITNVEQGVMWATQALTA